MTALDRARPNRRRLARAASGLSLVVVVAACTSSAGSPASSALATTTTRTPSQKGGTTAPSTGRGRHRAASVTGTDWTVYHRYASGSGRGPATLPLSHLVSAWTSKVLDGELYGEPLVWRSDVYVATEEDTVYALSAKTGGVIWSHHLATPVPAGDLPCGNIAPVVGITSTPVIDASRGELFVVADELVDGTAHHEFYGLDATTGRIEVSQGADPPGAYVPALLQRASLTLDDGRVVFGFGGNYGDCSTYHGFVESVPETGGRADFFEVDRGAGESQGAIWMGGAAPVVGSKGNLWVAAGNGSVSSPSGPYDDSDSVLELSPSLKLLQFFAPASWWSDNANDYDLGSEVPAVLPNGLVVQAGKSQTVYLLRAGKLGGIGHALERITGFCGNDVDGGVAFDGSTVYLPCENGVIAMATDAATKTFRELWQTPTGAGGPPILAGGYLWSLEGGTLYALSPRTGRAAATYEVGGAATDFPTPSVGDGLLLAPSADQVHAFRQS